MCLAFPLKINRIENNFGFVEHDAKEHRIELSLIDNPQVGDWILAHGELAVSRIPEVEAIEIIKLIKKAEV